MTRKNDRIGLWTLSKEMGFWHGGYGPNGPLYLDQAFHRLDKLVIKPKNTCKNNTLFLLKTQNDFFVLLFF
jgi:hypothetical protein